MRSEIEHSFTKRVKYQVVNGLLVASGIFSSGCTNSELPLSLTKFFSTPTPTRMPIEVRVARQPDPLTTTPTRTKTPTPLPTNTPRPTATETLTPVPKPTSIYTPVPPETSISGKMIYVTHKDPRIPNHGYEKNVYLSLANGENKQQIIKDFTHKFFARILWSPLGDRFLVQDGDGFIQNGFEAYHYFSFYDRNGKQVTNSIGLEVVYHLDDWLAPQSLEKTSNEFVSHKNYDPMVYIYNIDTKKFTPIIQKNTGKENLKDVLQGVKISPDRQNIAVSRYNFNNKALGLFVTSFSADKLPFSQAEVTGEVISPQPGFEKLTIFNNPGGSDRFDWSTDGQKLFYLAFGGELNVWQIKNRSRYTTKVPEHCDFFNAKKRVQVLKDEFIISCRGGILSQRLDRNTSSFVKIPLSMKEEDRPEFAYKTPEGKYIFLMHDNIYTVKSDGTNLRQVYTNLPDYEDVKELYWKE